MKRAFWILLCLLTSIMMSAQTQQGYVKTKGRMVKGQYVKGQGLPGASVTIQGSSSYVVNNSNGSFSFPVPAKTFLVQKVQKKGYELVDLDITRKSYQYSANPFYLVMETPEQQLQDKLDAERRLRRTLQQQLQKREDEIEAMDASLQEKQKLLQKLYQDQQTNEKLIADMAKEYAQMDYDQMDEKNQRISDAILNGRLTEADSLLRSKGDMNSRNQEIDRRLKAEAKEKEELAQRQENLAISEAGTQKLLEDFANDCYKYFNMFKLENKNDSALYYIELRALRDTTNVEWQLEAGLFIVLYVADYNKALTYYQRALCQSIFQDGEESEWVADSYNNIGYVYDRQGNYPKALEYYGKALAIREKVLDPEHPDVAESYNNIGLLYSKDGCPKALEYLSKALKIRMNELGSEHPYIAESYNNIGLFYSSQGDYPKALEYYNKALEILEKESDPEHLDVASTYNNIALVYRFQEEYPKALEYYSKSLAIREKVLGKEHPDVAISYNNIGTVYCRQKEYPKALEYYNKALAIQEKLLGLEHPDIAISYNNIGYVYGLQGYYAKALEFHQKALEIYEKVYGCEHPNVNTIRKDIVYLRYTEALRINTLSEFLLNYIFTATIVDGDTPAKKQGMSGEYVLLKYADWTQESTTSLFEKINEIRGYPVDLLVMKDGVISKHHFENIIGAQFGIRQVSKEERQRINKAYEEWKKQNRE